ncbi:glycoside hydrolase family 95 protein [Cohnella sp. 56]|uniref:glycoside hydrolase family 95 protein n=1 Tax=Cohnella sp. 56 TaxID=3113722 RepID=UPI0030E788B7
MLNVWMEDEQPDFRSGDVLWSEKPASEWAEGYPIGNGRLGAMVSGAPELERIGLNHDLLWRNYWKYQERGAASLLPEVRRLCKDGRWDEACELLLRKTPLTGEGLYVNPYVPVGDLGLRMLHREGAIEDYRRHLDMARGIAETTYRINGITFRRSYFCSWSEGVIVIRLTSDRAGSLSGEVSLSRLPDPECVVTGESQLGEVRMSGEFEEGKRFAAAVRIAQRGGRLTGGRRTYAPPGEQEPARNVKGIEFVFRDENDPDNPFGAAGASTCFDSADEVLLLVAIATDDGTQEDPLQLCLSRLDRVSPDYGQIRQAHIEDHGKYYGRAKLKLAPLGEPVASDALLRQACESDRVPPQLFELLFNLGRYAAIASGRSQPSGEPPKVPINLQGIWNQDRRPAWDCDLHLDMNLQMSYWPLHAVDLGEWFAPLMDWATRHVPQGERVARDLYDCRGVVFNVSVDANHQGVSDNMSYSWTGSAAWVAQLLWEHWEYERDERFLRESLYPFLKQIVLFYEDFLQEDDQGRLVPCPSGSPEMAIKGRSNWSMLSSPSTIDLELIRDMLSCALEASSILGTNAEKREVWRQMLDKVPLPRQKDGMLMEWLEEHEAADPGHRHRSHLIGLCPGNRISLEDTPADFHAARAALAERQRHGSGSSVAFSGIWDAQLLARMYDGEEAYKLLCDTVRNHVMDNLLMSLCDWRPRGNSLSWFGGRKLFQIESSLGIIASLAELLFQDRRGLLRLLPALPEAWRDGEISGFRGRGGLELDLKWRDGRFSEATIRTRLDRDCQVKLFRATGPFRVEKDGEVLSGVQSDEGVLSFRALGGFSYTIKPQR